MKFNWQVPQLLVLMANSLAAKNLVPSKPGNSPAYFCTWLAQGREWLSTANGLSPPAVENFWRHRTHDDFMVKCNQTYVFGNDSKTGRVGMAWTYPRARSDLYMMFDNGWQKGPEMNSDKLLWDDAKWPMFGNSTNGTLEPLTKFVSYVKSQGWKGVGLWVNGGDGVGPEQMQILYKAGVRMLKADGGDGACDKTRLARQLAPGLVVEHGRCVSGCPLNAGSRNGTRASLKDIQKQAEILQCTDLFRTYDTVKVFSIAEALDRQAQLLHFARNMSTTPGHCGPNDPECAALRLIGGSGEPSVTAALGGVLQPMRSNLRGRPLPPLLQPYTGEGPGSRHRQHREDEVERLMMWARIAPPFGVGRHGPELIQMDSEVLEDTWHFRLCDDAAVISHHLVNTTVTQAAPARVTRSTSDHPLPLPSVHTAQGDLAPFVVSTRFPNGPVAVTTLGRTRVREFTEPKAVVMQEVPHHASASCACGVCVPAIGVFGHFSTLVLNFTDTHNERATKPSKSHPPQTPRGACQVLAQDLVAREAVDITPHVTWGGSSAHRVMSVPGSVIESVGTMARSRSDDVSPPGLVLVLQSA